MNTIFFYSSCYFGGGYEFSLNLLVGFIFRIIRAPVPWHQTFLSLSEYNATHLFITNPIMQKLQDTWFES